MLVYNNNNNILVLTYGQFRLAHIKKKSRKEEKKIYIF